MGELVAKEKHEKRIEQKSRHIQRQVKIAKAMGHEVEKEPHRYAKHNALNCSTPNCPMCGNPRHHGYTKQRLTIQELKLLDFGKIDYE